MKHLAICTPEQWDANARTLGGAAHYIDLTDGRRVVIIDDAHVDVPAEFEQLPHLFVGQPLTGAQVSALAQFGIQPGAKPADVLMALGKVHPLFKF